MILSNIICTRWVGKDFGDWRSKIDRPIAPVLFFLETYYLWSMGWAISLLCAVAFPLWRYDGWGEQFLAMHGDKTHFNNRNKGKTVTKIADFLYTPRNVRERKIYGVIWGGLRGLYDLPAFIILGVLLQNYYIPLIGILMGLQGFVYYLVGRFIKQDTAPAEIAMGGFRGSLWLGALYA